MVGCGAGMLGVLESYDLHEHVQRRPTIPECNRERKEKLVLSADGHGTETIKSLLSNYVNGISCGCDSWGPSFL